MPSTTLLRHSLLAIILGGLCLLFFGESGQNSPDSDLEINRTLCEPADFPHVKRVAIIGAGSAGSSVAYYLQRFKSPCQFTNITIYERSDYVGGRSTTVNALDDPQYPLELGGSIFVAVNRILVSAAKEFGLRTKDAGTGRPAESPDTLGVWDGNEFVFTQTEGGYFYWNLAKLLWKYGTAPIRAQRLMKTSIGKFLEMYDEPNFPFDSLSEVSERLGLTAFTSTPGSVLFKANQIQPPFLTDIIQASTRVNYAQNLQQIHGLESLVCLATDGAMAIDGGNWRIFDGMIKASGAHLRLNNSVTKIEKQSSKLYRVESTMVGETEKSAFAEDYDVVVLAAPHQSSKIQVSGPDRLPDEIDYVSLHVTLLTTKHKLSPAYFNKPSGSLVPEIVLTTLPNHAEKSEKPTPFFSVSALRSVSNPSSRHGTEYAYKIFSVAPVTPALVSQLFAFTTSAEKLEDISKDDISWLHLKTWQSYPYLHPRVTFEDPVLDTDFYYTSGIESFIATMETSAMMGRNVAKLIANSWNSTVSYSSTKLEL